VALGWLRRVKPANVGAVVCELLHSVGRMALIQVLLLCLLLLQMQFASAHSPTVLSARSSISGAVRCHEVVGPRRLQYMTCSIHIHSDYTLLLVSVL
jgi:hypothetical protein